MLSLMDKILPEGQFVSFQTLWLFDETNLSKQKQLQTCHKNLVIGTHYNKGIEG